MIHSAISLPTPPAPPYPLSEKPAAIHMLSTPAIGPKMGWQSGEYAPGEAAQGKRWSDFTANPAVVALLDRAEARDRAGLYEQAAAALERALRLEPRNAMLWHRLARVRLNQGQWQDAVELAAKSNSLATGNPDLRGLNWAVIAEAKERQGDRQGAREARKRMEAEGAVR